MKIVQGLIIDATVCLPVEGLFFPIGEMCVSLCVCVRMQASAPACVCVCTCLWPDWIVEICVRCLSAAADTQVADPSTLCHHWYSPQRSGRAVTQPKRGRGATDLWWEPEAWRRKGTDRESKRKKKRERQRERKRKKERQTDTGHIINRNNKFCIFSLIYSSISPFHNILCSASKIGRLSEILSCVLLKPKEHYRVNWNFQRSRGSGCVWVHVCTWVCAWVCVCAHAYEHLCVCSCFCVCIRMMFGIHLVNYSVFEGKNIAIPFTWHYPSLLLYPEEQNSRWRDSKIRLFLFTQWCMHQLAEHDMTLEFP